MVMPVTAPPLLTTAVPVAVTPPGGGCEKVTVGGVVYWVPPAVIVTLATWLAPATTVTSGRGVDDGSVLTSAKVWSACMYCWPLSPVP